MRSCKSLVRTVAVAALMGISCVGWAQDEQAAKAEHDPNPKVVYQGLDELFRRLPIFHEKDLDAMVVDGKVPGELLFCRDVDTGAEVWRLTWHRGWNAIHSHINRSPWNADRSKIGIWSNRGMLARSLRPIALRSPELGKCPSAETTSSNSLSTLASFQRRIGL